MHSHIRNIVFDLGGVLVDLHMQRCLDAFHALGFSDAERYVSQWHPAEVLSDFERGAITIGQLRSFICAKAGRDISEEQIRHAYNAFIGEIPDYKLTMLRQLRDRFKVYMLSNTNEIVFPPLARTQFRKQGLRIEDYFDKVYLSYEMKMLKPSTEIFRALLDDAGIEASQTLFIDDSKRNTDAAAGLGFHTYLASAEEDFRHIFKGL